jgi:tRNA A37 threonylcarbamoyladenosine biosynthesis protein TsaE
MKADAHERERLEEEIRYMESRLLEIGFDDYARGDGVCLIEWADKFLDQLPSETMTLVHFAHRGPAERAIEISFPQ